MYQTLLNFVRRNPEHPGVATSYILRNRLPGWEELKEVKELCADRDPVASGYTEYVEHFLIEKCAYH